MPQDRLWNIDTDDFANAVAAITSPIAFDRDEFVYTWQCSWFRFVRSSLSTFDTLVQFAAMAIYTTPETKCDVTDWVRDVNITTIFPDRQLGMLNAARGDCLHKDEGDRVIPDWLKFDGPIIDAFAIQGRSGSLSDMEDHEIYRTAESYYYLSLNQQS